MKQQNKRPPKPKKQAGPSAGQPSQSKAPGTKISGKENQAEINREQTLQHKNSLDREKEQPNSTKQRFKSGNGANRSSSQQGRPHMTSTIVVANGQTLLENQLKAQRQLYSAMGNAQKLDDFSRNNKREPVIQDIEIFNHDKKFAKENMLENSIGSWLQKQNSQAESKYSSTRIKRQTIDREAAITGRRVDQPRVVVGDVDSHDVFNNIRFSPQREKHTATAQLPLQIRKASKKSKSQTIQGSSLQTQKNAWARRGMKPQRMMEFLDTSIVNPGAHNESFRLNDELAKRDEGNEKDLTLKILTQTADNINLSQSKSGQRQRPRSMERSKVQMKYLNFHRENVLKSQFKQNKADPTKRCTTALNAVHSNRNFERQLNKSTSADRIHRLAGTQSPLNKSGQVKSSTQRQQKKQKKEQLTKSANEMQASQAISSLAFPNFKNESDKAMLQFKQPAQQNNSTMPGPNDQSQISLIPSTQKLSQQNVKKHKSSISPERAAKIDKFIRENIRREKQAQETRRREQKQREASSVRRKQQLEQKNQYIRQLNRDKIQRRRLKLKENMTISGDEQEPNDIKQFEKALLAVSDGAHNIDQATKNFDSRSSQKVFSRGGLRTQQLGQVSSSLKMQLAQLQAADDLNGVHRKSQGMDFIDVRREISNELKSGKSRLGIKTLKKDVLNGVSLMDSAFMLQTSKSQKQNFVPLRTQINQSGIAQASIEKKPTQLTQVKQENMLFKRNQIRKFMREKAKQMQSKADQQKAEEISTFKKVRSNLTKLNNFVQKRFGQMQVSGITTPALKVKRQHKKNVTVVYDEKEAVQGTALRQSRHQDRTITPTKGGLFENSDVSLNISGQNPRGQNRSVLGQLTQKDFQKLHDTLYEDSRLSSIQTLEERSIKRGAGIASNALGVCFEKSASQKALRKQMQASPIPESRNSSKKRPRSALNISQVNRQSKRKIKSSKRSKSQSGTKKVYLPMQGKLTVRLPNQNRDESHHHRLPSNLKMTDSTAAKIIQKEVRKFLSSLGFYEARQIEDQADDQNSPRLTSHNNSQQINLFIEPMKSRDRSPSRHRQSNSSKRKTRVDYSPDYEIIQPSSHKKGNSLRPSPLKQLKPSKIEKLSVDENDINNSRTRKTQSHHSSEEANSNKKPLNNQIIEDSDANLKAIKSSAERKRASAEVRNIKQLGLLGVKPVRTKDIKLNAQHDYNGSSHESSQLPGLHSVTTPQSSKLMLGQQRSNQISSSPHPSDVHQPSAEQNGDAVSQSSSSLFDRNTFQQFSQKRLSQIMKNNEYHKLIQFREECLVFRERKEKKLINKLLSENQMTPRTYQQRKLRIEKWVNVQRAEIEKTKQGFKEEWEKTMQMIEDTQKNVDHMRIKIATAINGADSNSYSQASSRYNNGKPPRSYLIEEAPKSYRSGYQDPKPENNNIEEDSQGFLSARKTDLQNLADRNGANAGGQSKYDNHSTSKSEIKQQRESRDRSASDVLAVGNERQQSMTGGKSKEFDRLNDGSRQKSSTGTAFELENQSNQDQLPSAAFLNRLEKATHGLLPQDSAEGTLKIEEHSFADDLLDDNGPSCKLQFLKVHIEDGFDEDKKGIPKITDNEETFEDGNFKNRLVQIKGLTQLFAGESNGNSEAVSDHKSEPQMFDPAELSEETSSDLKISEMLRKKMELRLKLNYEDENDLVQEPAIISSNKFVPAVTKPVPPLSSLQSDEYKLKLVDQITEQLISQMIQDSFEVPLRAKSQQKTAEKSPAPGSSDQDVYIIDSLAMDKDEKKEWIEIRQRHLIEGSLIRVDQYVNEMLDVLLQFDISDISENSDFDYEVKTTDNFHIQFLKLLTQPIQRPAIESLTQMQTSELGSYTHFETTLDVSKHPIVPVDLYLEIEKAREESLLVRRKNADKKTLQVWESVHIFNKCIFDAINESLMKFRPYGIVGQPMPWSNKVRRLQTKVEIASVDTERLFQMVKQEIFRWTQVFCGCLPGPVFYFPNPRTGKDEFQEDLLQEVRERRLTTVLTQDTVEHEHHWLNYEFEETQVKVDLSDMILEQLVGELIGFLQQQNNDVES